MSACPCKFDDLDLELFSPDWYQAHRVHHLATFPDVDHGTRRNLDLMIERAETVAAERAA